MALTHAFEDGGVVLESMKRPPFLGRTTLMQNAHAKLRRTTAAWLEVR